MAVAGKTDCRFNLRPLKVANSFSVWHFLEYYQRNPRVGDFLVVYP